jgi:hypothetical protein
MVSPGGASPRNWFSVTDTELPCRVCQAQRQRSSESIVDGTLECKLIRQLLSGVLLTILCKSLSKPGMSQKISCSESRRVFVVLSPQGTVFHAGSSKKHRRLWYKHPSIYRNSQPLLDLI